MKIATTKTAALLAALSAFSLNADTCSFAEPFTLTSVKSKYVNVKQTAGNRFLGNLKNLPAHKLAKPAANLSGFSAAPFGDFVLLEQIVVFVRAFHKQHVIGELSDFLEELFLLRTAVPDKPEIPADNKRVVFPEFPQ